MGLLFLTSACGDSSDTVVRPPSSPAPVTTPTPSQEPSRLPRHPVVTTRPATGLVDGQVVRVTGSGFSAGISLVVVQCADKGSKTSSGDCNIAALVSVRADAEGKVATPLTVRKGPFGSPPQVCSARQRCLVSVTEAALAPSEEADGVISFR